jgi:hypothetical protein
MLNCLICCSSFNLLKSGHIRVLHSHTQGSEQIFTIFRFLPIDRCRVKYTKFLKCSIVSFVTLTFIITIFFYFSIENEKKKIEAE